MDPVLLDVIRELAVTTGPLGTLLVVGYFKLSAIEKKVDANSEAIEDADERLDKLELAQVTG